MTDSDSMIHVCMLVTNRAVDDPRVCMEATALAATGRYRVTVVGWDREIDQDIRQRQGGVDFVRLHLRSTHARGLGQAWFLWRFWRRAMRALRELRPQVVHCHDLDTLWPGARIAGRMDARLVFDAHENYPDMMDGHLPGLAVRALRRHERRLVRRADLVVTVGGKLCEHYRQRGAKKAVVVGNWKDARDYEFTPERIASRRQSLGLKPGQIAVVFIGGLGRDRQIAPLLEAIGRDDRFACVIGGTGSQEGLVRQFAAGGGNVKYLGRVEPSDVPLLTAACDAVYYGLDATNPNLRWSAPNKLYEAVAAGKAIIAGDFGEVGPTVRESGCGILADTSTPEGVLAALAQLAKPGELARLSHAARSLQIRYCARAAGETLLAAYSELTSAAAAGRYPPG